MTVSYNQEVASVRCGGFLRLLLKWKGSIYRLVWFELFVFLGLYMTISLSYHFVMNDQSKRTFELVAQYCNKYSYLMPLSFVLGFYVQRVIVRFYEQFNSIPWPHRLAIYVSTYVEGADERGRMMRRTIMRYVFLSFVMTMSSISPPIKKRFPTLTHMTEAGFLMPNEKQILESMSTLLNKYFVPITWAASIIDRARKEGKIKSDFAVQRLLTEINDFRGGCATLFNFDWVSIPMGYTQVVTLAVYIFCLSCLLGRYDFEVGNPAEKNFPFFTILQFVFYVGWLKVAQSGLSPFGEDDDDFDINLLVDRYLHESYIIVDELFMKSPEMSKDKYWGLVDFDLPYTAAAMIKKKIHVEVANGLKIPADKHSFKSLETSHGELRSNTSATITSTQSIPGGKRRLLTVPIMVQTSTSKESVVIPGGVSSVRSMAAIPEPQPSGIAVGQQPVKPSTSTGQLSSASSEQLLPTISAGKQQSTSTGEQSSTFTEQQPSTSAGQQPSTSDGQQLSTAVEQQPSTLITQQESNLMARIREQQASTSAGKQPSTSAREQSSTSADKQPSTSNEEQPSTSVEQQPSTLITQQESNLMAKIQDELDKLRSTL